MKLSKYHKDTNEILKLYNQELVSDKIRIKLINTKTQETIATTGRQEIVDKIIFYHKSSGQ